MDERERESKWKKGKIGPRNLPVFIYCVSVFVMVFAFKCVFLDMHIIERRANVFLFQNEGTMLNYSKTLYIVYIRKYRKSEKSVIGDI